MAYRYQGGNGYEIGHRVDRGTTLADRRRIEAADLRRLKAGVVEGLAKAFGIVLPSDSAELPDKEFCDRLLVGLMTHAKTKELAHAEAVSRAALRNHADMPEQFGLGSDAVARVPRARAWDPNNVVAEEIGPRRAAAIVDAQTAALQGTFRPLRRRSK